MKQIFKVDEWAVIEDGLHLADNRLAESVMSLGNGHMGMRGNFEEQFSGDSLQGTYIAGVYYPDRTRVGWWKIGYPEYFAKVLNATNFVGIDVEIDGKPVDLATANVKDFKRVLNMHHGYLLRTFAIVDDEGRETRFEVKRFLSRARREIGAVAYSVTPVNHSTQVTFTPYLDGDVTNEDSNYGEKFWLEQDRQAEPTKAMLTMQTKKLDFIVCSAMQCSVEQANRELDLTPQVIARDKYVANTISVSVPANTTTTLYKYIAVTTNRDHPDDRVAEVAADQLQNACSLRFESLLEEHAQTWEKLWQESDINICGDPKAQQGIRFNIFQLNQTYTGEDARLNIGPKGFTGEKYGGSTYWDTEAYCLPFYLSTGDSKIARNLLIYRYNHLNKAKENARKLGCQGALYPMVTMNGEECHNEWEITFEEIHRNAAISYAIFNYVRYTKDEDYLGEYGFEVLVETSRYWASRVNYHSDQDVYMILGVTGPNEYENNVNNNWYTNRMAAWNLEYTLEVKEYLENSNPTLHDQLVSKMSLTSGETRKWQDIVNKMYYPYVKQLGVFEQQDNYMDKPQQFVDELDVEDLPLNQNWSWDRILRSCFIKQADVLQGMFFLYDRYDRETKRRNFDFYEPRTVHESSLSPCVHSILAAEIGYHERAYELYLRTARLDLDNYNNDTDDGLHITSMAGTWMSIVYGFGGMRILDDKLNLNPFIPATWERYSFKLTFRGHLLKVEVTPTQITITHEAGDELAIRVSGKDYMLANNEKLEIAK